jgi:hypothetical protein
MAAHLTDRYKEREPAPVPHTIPLLDPTRPPDERIYGLQSPSEAASVWTNKLSYPHPCQFEFALVNLNRQDIMTSSDRTNVMAKAIMYLSSIISRIRGNGFNRLFAIGKHRKDVRLSDYAIEQDRAITAYDTPLVWSFAPRHDLDTQMCEHVHGKASMKLTQLEVIDSIAVYLSDLGQRVDEAIMHAVATLHGQGKVERLVVFVRESHESMAEFHKEEHVYALPVFFADADGKFPAAVLDKGIRKACLVVAIDIFHYNMTLSSDLEPVEKLYALIQMDAAWRFIYCVREAQIAMFNEFASQRGPMGDDMPIEAMRLVAGYGTMDREVEEHVAHARHLAQVARERDRARQRESERREGTRGSASVPDDN